MKKETIKVAIELNAKIETRQRHLADITERGPRLCVYKTDRHIEIPISKDLLAVFQTLAIAEITKDIESLSAELESL